jgi:hypothetical protein
MEIDDEEQENALQDNILEAEAPVDGQEERGDTIDDDDSIAEPNWAMYSPEGNVNHSEKLQVNYLILSLLL